MKLNDEQLASLSSQKAVNEYLEHQKDNITRLIKQNLAVGDVFKRENLQVIYFPSPKLAFDALQICLPESICLLYCLFIKHSQSLCSAAFN